MEPFFQTSVFPLKSLLLLTLVGSPYTPQEPIPLTSEPLPYTPQSPHYPPLQALPTHLRVLFLVTTEA